MKLHFLTGNPFKIQTAEFAWAAHDVEIVPVTLDLPEIQAHSSVEVARHSAEKAAQLLRAPVIREDHAFHIPALGGIPGPYMSYFERNLPAESVLRLLENVEDRSAYFELGLVYVDPHDDVRYEFVHQVPFQIVAEPRGSLPELALGKDGEDFAGWSPILQLVGESGTLAEAPPEDRLKYFTANFDALAKKLF